MKYHITITKRKKIELARRVLNICALRRADVPEYIVTMTTTFKVEADNEEQAYEKAVEYNSDTNIVGVDYTVEPIEEGSN